MPTAARPSSKRPPSVSSEPNTTKIPSFTTSTRSSAWDSNDARMSGRRMPRTMAQTNVAISPLPCGGRTAAP